MEVLENSPVLCTGTLEVPLHGKLILLNACFWLIKYFIE